MSRAAVWSLLKEDPVLHQYQPDMFGNNAIDSLTRENISIVMSWGDSNPSDRVAFHDMDVQVQDLRVWVHVNKYISNDYGKINKILARIKELLTTTFHKVGADGRVFSHADWRGDSADLTDDVLNTLTRNSTFRVVHRKA